MNSRLDDELVFAVLAPSPDPMLLRVDASWPKLRRAATRGGVAPLVAFAVRSHVTGDAKMWCDRVLAQSWQRHLNNLADLHRVLGILESAGVRALALKGPALACRHYDPPFLRKPSIDLDLAVREADLDAACAALATAGYQLAIPLRLAKKVSHHLVLEHASKPRLELHYGFSRDLPGPPMGDLFDRASTYADESGPISILSPPDEILHLIRHLVQDRFGTILHFYEVERVWKSAAPDVRAEVLQAARRYGYVSTFKLADAALRCVWGRGLTETPSDLPSTWMDRRLNAKLFRAMRENAVPVSARTPLTRLRGRWFDLQVTDSPADAMRILRGAMGVAGGVFLNFF